VLIDCPPSLSLLTVNAMVAADAVVVPLQCEFFALEGLSQLLKTIDLVRENLNPSLEIQGIVLTMFDKRNKLSDQVAADVRQNMGAMVLQHDDPRNVRVSGAEPWPAGAGLRSSMSGKSGLYQACGRAHPARADARGRMRAEAESLAEDLRRADWAAASPL